MAMPVQLKALLTRIVAAMLILLIGYLLVRSIRFGWKKRIEIINGHEYVVYPEMEGVEMEHSPDCSKCEE